MSTIYTQTYVADGVALDAEIIQDPNIDDVIKTEAKVTAYEIATGGSDSTRRVSREVRDLLVRFGVQR